MRTCQPLGRLGLCVVMVLMGWGGAPIRGQVVPPVGDPIVVAEVVGLAHPRVAVVDLQGNFVVVWNGEDGYADGIFARRFARDGSPAGEPFQVNTQTTGFQQEAAVASGFDGEFVVVWTTTTTSDAGTVSGRRFGPEGALGEPFEISGGIEQSRLASVSQSLSGDFTVVWEAAAKDIYTATYDREGVEIAGPTRVARTCQATLRDAPGVAKDLVTGNTVVVWGRDRLPSEESPCEDNPETILARRFDAQGHPLGDVFEVSETEGTNRRSPSVATEFDGGFRIVWVDDDQVWYRRFEADGSSAETFRLDQAPSINFFSTRVIARDLDGSAVASWADHEDGRLYVRWLPADPQDAIDNPVPPFEVGDGNAEGPGLAGDLEGNVVVSWSDLSDDILGVRAQRFAAPVELQVNDLSILEGDPAENLAVFTVQASKAHIDPEAVITVDFATADDTATFLEDYEQTFGTLVLDTSGSLSGTVVVPIVEDDLFEQDETFLLQLGNPTNAVLRNKIGVGTILDDDSGGLISASDVETTEGEDSAHTLLFPVVLEPSQGLEATVSYRTGDLTAIAGQDYQATSGILSFPPGSTRADIAVQVFGDQSVEPDEEFGIELFDAAGATIAPPCPDCSGFHAIGKIISDDFCPEPQTLEPTSVSFPVGGGTSSVQVLDPAGCGWDVVESSDWISVLATPDCPPESPADCIHGGTGDGVVEIEALENPGLDERGDSMILADRELPIRQDGDLCNFIVDPVALELSANGDSATLAITASNEVCTWSAASEAEWIELSDEGGTGSSSLELVVAANDGPPRASTVRISASVVSVDQRGNFFDHFADGTLAEDWLYFPDAMPWSEEASFLRGDATTVGAARAIADPAFEGCTVCTVESVLKVDLFSKGRVGLLGWYGDSENHVTLWMDEFANTWSLVQRVSGVDTLLASNGMFTILVDQLYEVALFYDGESFRGTVDGVPVFDVPAVAGSSPEGTVGLVIEDTAASFDWVRANRTTGGVTSFGDPLFADGFESGDTSSWSLAVSH